MKNETPMVQDPQFHTLPVGSGRSRTRNDHHSLGEAVSLDRFYSHDGIAGSHWQGRESSPSIWIGHRDPSGAEYWPSGADYPESQRSRDLAGSDRLSDESLAISRPAGRLNEIMVGLVGRYKYSSAYLTAVLVLAVMSEVVF